MGQESEHSLVGSLPKILQSCPQGVGWAMFSSGGLTRGEIPFKFIQVVSRIYFFVAI